MMFALKTIYKYLRFWGGKYRCNICSTKVRTFFPLSIDLQSRAISNGFPFDFRRMETLNYDKCNCPFCLSSDRERLYMLYIEKYVAPQERNYSILDFAPNKAFSERLRAQQYDYTSTDLYRNDVDIKLDICDMKEVDDSRYDLIICSHVLEHVPDPNRALGEIFRVLVPGAVAIIMVPLFWDVRKTVEDASHNTAELRLKYYGQDDHVRLFSREDFLDRIRAAGFEINQLTPSDFDQQKIVEYAISDNSILYVCLKPLNGESNA